MFILALLFNDRQLCVIASALYQAIEKYKDLYNKMDSFHNKRTLQNIRDMQYIHDLCEEALKIMNELVKRKDKEEIE